MGFPAEGAAPATQEQRGASALADGDRLGSSRGSWSIPLGTAFSLLVWFGPLGGIKSKHSTIINTRQLK